MPRICEFLGIFIYMYFSDHAPPHFHAIYGQYEAEVSIESSSVIRGSLPPRATALVQEWAAIYKKELEVNWDRARSHEPMSTIPALE